MLNICHGPQHGLLVLLCSGQHAVMLVASSSSSTVRWPLVYIVYLKTKKKRQRTTPPLMWKVNSGVASSFRRAHLLFFFFVEWTTRGSGLKTVNGLRPTVCPFLFISDFFFSLLHLKKKTKKTGSVSSPSFSNVFVSQECESSRNRLINLRARRQSRPRSRRSAWDTDERSAPDKKERGN